MSAISHFSIKRPVTTTMLIFALVVSGLLGLRSLKTELMPDFTIPVAIIRAPFVGASPEDVETLVTQKIEDAITGVDGIESVITYSYQDVSTIVIQFKYGEDIDKKVRDLQREVDAIKSDLPEDVDNIVVDDIDINATPIINYFLYGDNLSELKNIAEDKVKPAIEKIGGVGEVQISGGYEEEILVEINPNIAESYGISAMQIYAILQSSNINLPLGVLQNGDKEYVIRILGELKTIDEIKNIVIRNSAGKILRLSDIADVKSGFKDVESYARQDGQETLNISVVKTKEGNIVEVTEKVRKEIAKISETLPSNIKFSLGTDNSVFIDSSIGTVTNNAIMGLILASIILFVFLKNFRATIIIALGIPTSIIGTFLLLSIKGISLNVISLMGLALGVGMLVDNSVVVLDNIFRHITEYGEDIETGAANGASEMAVPIIASTATTVAVFIPMVIKEGMAKEIFQDMSYSIAFALLASLLIALTFVPMLASKFLNPEKTVSSSGKIFNSVKLYYSKVLDIALRNKVKTVLISILITVLLVFIGVKTLNFEMMPKTDEGKYTVVAKLAKGIDIEKANRIGLEIEDIVANDKNTLRYNSIIDNENVTVTVEVADKKHRKKSIEDIVGEVRGKFSNIRDASFTIASSSSMGGGGGVSTQISLKILGSDMESVKKVSEEVLSEMKNIYGFVDVQSSFDGGNPQVQIYIDRAKAQSYGVRVADIVPLVATQVKGDSAFTIKNGTKEVDVTVRLAEAYRNSPESLLQLPVNTPKGVIKLSEIAYTKLQEGPAFIQKEDRLINITLGANLDGMKLRDANKELKDIMDSKILPPGVKYSFGGDTEDFKEVIGDLGFSLTIALFLVYFILAAQFESFQLPILIMGSVPLAVSGVIIGLEVTRFKFNIMVMVGIIMLAGIVVNNAIVLIDYINLLRAKGEGLEEAVKESGQTRLRPILMTTLTTVFGMVPLALGIGDGSEIYQGMAIAVIFGLVFSTLLTLVYIPALYVLVEKRKEKRKIMIEEQKKKRRKSLFKS